MSRKHKKVCKTLSYIKHFLIIAFTITGCISFSDFDSLIGILIRLLSYASGLKIWAIAAGITRYKSIIKEKKKHDEVVLLAKSKLNSIEIFISKALIPSNISHDKFVLTKNVLKEYANMKKEIKTL